MITTHHGDCRAVLQTLAPGSVQCVVTSPPYYGLRKYSDDPREIGQEATPDCLAWVRLEPPCGACYVCAMRAVFAQLWRVLRDDGTVWLNLGDSYAGNKVGNTNGLGGSTLTTGTRMPRRIENEIAKGEDVTRGIPAGLKPKDLLGIPWRVALALQADGYYLRSDIVWNKPNCMPESVTDRPTRAHEYVFLLAKQARYYYDADAIRESHSVESMKSNGIDPSTGKGYQWNYTMTADDRNVDGLSGNLAPGVGRSMNPAGRNRRTVWTIATQPYSGAHYATMPEALIEPCILAGSAAQACEHCGAAWRRVVERTDEIDASAKGSRFDAGKTAVNGQGRTQEGERYTTRDLGFAPRCTCADNTGSARSIVLDPFAGSGTVLRVAARYQRSAIGIELSKDYINDHVNERTANLQLELFV